MDLSQSNSFPPVRSQGEISSCVAWACTYYQFGYQVAAMKSWNVKNDTSKQFSPRWIYNLTNNGEDAGCQTENVYKILQTHGAVRFSECTPTGVKTISEYRNWYLNEDALKQALKYRIVDNEHLSFASISMKTPITAYNSDCLNAMKSFLNEGHILTVSTEFGQWDYKTLSSQSNSALNGEYVCIKAIDSNSENTGHRMAIVGYDDTITYDLNGNGTIQDFEKGAFKLVNSHGTDYANSGFVWVMYDALNKTSNATQQNSSYRISFFKNNAYDVISVAEFPVDLVAKVTIGQNLRNQTQVELGVSTIENSNPSDSIETLVNFNRPFGFFNYSGTGTTYEEATFVFDFSSLFNLYSQRMRYYVSVSDRPIETNSTTIKKIELVDSTGKSVVQTNTTSVINGNITVYGYKIGLIGDVNNDGDVNVKDATIIQKYGSDLEPMTSDDLIVADTNGDGKVTISDATEIQKYMVGLLTEFSNGKVAILP